MWNASYVQKHFSYEILCQPETGKPSKGCFYPFFILFEISGISFFYPFFILPGFSSILDILFLSFFYYFFILLSLTWISCFILP